MKRLSLLLASLALSQPVLAIGLPGLIRDSEQSDPSVLEAKARAEEAKMQLEASRAEHWPTLGIEGSGQRNWADKDRRIDERESYIGLVARLNLYAGGAIQARINRDEHRAALYDYKIRETREEISWQIASLYLQALRAKEAAEVEERNLERHHKIISDLKTIVANDPGRRSELVQAEGRALQVSMRIDQYRKTMRLAESRLSRYYTGGEKITLENPFEQKDWQVWVNATASENGGHPSLLAQQEEAQAVRENLKNIRASNLMPRLDLEVGAGTQNQRHARVVMNWDALNRNAYYTAKGAASQLSAAENRTEQMKRDLEERAQTAVEDMSRSRAQIEASAAQIATAKEVASLYEMQFKVARRSLLDVLNAYSELSSVEVSAVNARNDWRAAVASYLYANAGFGRWAQGVDIRFESENFAAPTAGEAAKPMSAGQGKGKE